ncbi:M48 family metallopeptidase [Herbaspirillum sp. RV1423]|uniref:M48 family metallopeptidase n=1 Tax=Herbaspirillum sp. RV1423 TaxID=1443993 RepID=UPI0004B22130|nr:M48 family metallopeptidase [Herbaspirillum sp. RV1423]
MCARQLGYWGKIRIALAVVPAALLAACVTPQDSTLNQPAQTAPAPVAKAAPAPTPDQVALRALTAQQDRLYKIAAPLLTSNAPLCRGNARNLLGFTAKNKYSYPTEFANAAQSLGFGERLQVTGVLPGSGAAKSGVQRGDILLAIADKPLQQGPDAERQAANLLGPLMTGRAPIKLTILRNKSSQNAQQNVVVPLTLACAFSIELGNADNVNTYADGRRVLITRGMMNFAKTDEELAYLIAKDMAHNSLGHAIRQRMVATTGSVIDNLMRAQPDPTATAGTGGIRPYPQDLDAAADNLALYMLVRAGYGIDDYPAFWQRLATQYPASVPNGYTALHPATAYRMTMIDKSTQTLKAKQAAGKPLMP